MLKPADELRFVVKLMRQTSNIIVSLRIKCSTVCVCVCVCAREREIERERAAKLHNGSNKCQ